MGKSVHSSRCHGGGVVKFAWAEGATGTKDDGHRTDIIGLRVSEEGEHGGGGSRSRSLWLRSCSALTTDVKEASCSVQARRAASTMMCVSVAPTSLVRLLFVVAVAVRCLITDMPDSSL